MKVFLLVSLCFFSSFAFAWIEKVGDDKVVIQETGNVFRLGLKLQDYVPPKGLSWANWGLNDQEKWGLAYDSSHGDKCQLVTWSLPAFLPSTPQTIVPVVKNLAFKGCRHIISYSSKNDIYIRSGNAKIEMGRGLDPKSLVQLNDLNHGRGLYEAVSALTPEGDWAAGELLKNPAFDPRTKKHTEDATAIFRVFDKFGNKKMQVEKKWAKGNWCVNENFSSRDQCKNVRYWLNLSTDGSKLAVLVPTDIPADHWHVDQLELSVYEVASGKLLALTRFKKVVDLYSAYTLSFTPDNKGLFLAGGEYSGQTFCAYYSLPNLQMEKKWGCSNINDFVLKHQEIVFLPGTDLAYHVQTHDSSLFARDPEPGGFADLLWGWHDSPDRLNRYDNYAFTEVTPDGSRMFGRHGTVWYFDLK